MSGARPVSARPAAGPVYTIRHPLLPLSGDSARSVNIPCSHTGYALLRKS